MSREHLFLVVTCQESPKNGNADYDTLRRTSRELHYDTGAFGNKQGYTSLKMFVDHHVVYNSTRLWIGSGHSVLGIRARDLGLHYCARRRP